jgi:hypothetical protein
MLRRVSGALESRIGEILGGHYVRHDRRRRHLSKDGSIAPADEESDRDRARRRKAPGSPKLDRKFRPQLKPFFSFGSKSRDIPRF